jgi:fructose transport system permease protein
VIAVVAFSILNERFLSAANLGLVLQQVTVIAVLALGQTLVILTAGIDLSAGAIAVFSSILMAKLATDAGLPGLLALLLGFVLGTAMGLANGLLVTLLKLPPFIVTLGTLSIYFSLNSVISKSETIRGADMPGPAALDRRTRSGRRFNLTYGSIIMLLLFAVFWYALAMTAWGKHVYATGDDIEAARLAGIRTKRVLLSVYTCAGALYAVGAWVLMGRLASASPTSAPSTTSTPSPPSCSAARACSVAAAASSAPSSARSSSACSATACSWPASRWSGRASRSACWCWPRSRSTSGSGR